MYLPHFILIHIKTKDLAALFLKKYPWIMNLYPPEYIHKFSFDDKYMVY